nr:ataxia telangiectasia mutated family protein [Tanacetum cinerariifolium]
MDEPISVSCVIERLPYSWKDFKHTLKHTKDKLTLVKLGNHLHIEESLRAQEIDKPRSNNVVGISFVNMIELNNFTTDEIYDENILLSIPRPSHRILNSNETDDDIGILEIPDEYHQRCGEGLLWCSYWVIEDPYGQYKVAEKQARFRELLSCREWNQEERLRSQKRYKEVKKEAKKLVAQAKEKAYEDLYKKIDSKEGENDISRITKARERRRDLGDLCIIKDEEGRTITDDEEIGGILFIPLRCERSKGTRRRRSSIEAIHLIRSLMEKFRERQRDMHLAFLDLEKAYNSVPRELIWKTLVDKGTSRRYIKVIKDMYDGARTRVRILMGNTEFFLVEVGLHQGSTISPYLFALILDELSIGIQEDIPWCLIFADDIALVLESAKGLSNRLVNWREALEDNGLRGIAKVALTCFEWALGCNSGLDSSRGVEESEHREETEYLRCDFGKVEITHNAEVDIRVEDKILQPKESFRYLGSMIHKSGRIDEDVSHHIKMAWLKWRVATGAICDRNIPLKLKGKFYRVAIRPSMLYGSECWPITKSLANRMEVAELRMLRWTCGKTMLDMIPNEVYRAELEVVTIINKMREGRLRWFRYVRRRPQSAPVRRVEALVVDGVRRRGRSKLRWEDRVKHDLKELLLSEDMTSDRNEWRARINLGGLEAKVVFVLVDPLDKPLAPDSHDLQEVEKPMMVDFSPVGPCIRLHLTGDYVGYKRNAYTESCRHDLCQAIRVSSAPPYYLDD